MSKTDHDLDDRPHASCGARCPYPIERWANEPLAADAVVRGTRETIASIDYAPPDLSLSARGWWIIGWLALMAWGGLGIVWLVCRALVGTW